MQDKTFKQAMEELTDRIASQLRQEILSHTDFLDKGQTVAEATADIQDERMREVVKDMILAFSVLSLVDTLHALGTLNQEQANELHMYLSSRLLSEQSRKK